MWFESTFITLSGVTDLNNDCTHCTAMQRGAWNGLGGLLDIVGTADKAPSCVSRRVSTFLCCRQARVAVANYDTVRQKAGKR